MISVWKYSWITQGSEFQCQDFRGYTFFARLFPASVPSTRPQSLSIGFKVDQWAQSWSNAPFNAKAYTYWQPTYAQKFSWFLRNHLILNKNYDINSFHQYIIVFPLCQILFLGNLRSFWARSLEEIT